MKVFYFLTFLLVIAMGWGMYLKTTYTEPVGQIVVNNPVSTTTGSTPKPSIPTKTPPTTVPTKPTSKCGSGGLCTTSDITPHNTKNDCWVYLSPINKAYNVTSYVSDGNKHPGGDIIAPYCGENIYTFFIERAGGHAHSNKAISILDAYYIGEFQP